MSGHSAVGGGGSYDIPLWPGWPSSVGVRVMPMRGRSGAKRSGPGDGVHFVRATGRSLDR